LRKRITVSSPRRYSFNYGVSEFNNIAGKSVNGTNAIIDQAGAADHGS